MSSIEITSVYPKFIPLETAAYLYSKWDCQVVTKQHEGIYFKCLEGNGTIQMINGNKYEGNFQNGMFHGQGVFRWNNGIIYTGSFQQNQLIGKGKFQWPDGSTYQGQIKEGYRHGFGKYINQKEKYVYQGFWLKGKKHGKGKITFNNGKSYYQGQFQNDLKHGFGKMLYPSQNQYQGYWRQNKKDGKGVMNWNDIHEKYAGDWKNDVPQGYGEYYWFDNKVEFKILKNIYKGQWKNGKRNGLGAFFYSNGCKFQGFYKNNLKQGLGISYDQYGFAKIEQYKQDKPSSLLQRTLQKIFLEDSSNQQGPAYETSKLPKLPKNSQNVHLTSNGSKFENQYAKYVDFKHPEIDGKFFNFLLRLNTRLRNLYKSLCLPSFEVKDFYTGMTLENYWKILRDSKILNQNISLIKISKEFYKGERSFFEVTPPDQQIFKILQNNAKFMETKQLGKLLWNEHMNKLKSKNMDWNSMKVEQNIDLPHYQQKNISKSSQVILYRHFVCLIIHTAAISLGQSQSLKNRMENVISCLEQCTDNLKISTEKEKINDNITQFSQHKTITVPDWIKPVHDELIKIICPSQPDLFGKVEIFVPVRIIYSILQENGLFKDSNQKIQSLERMQRYLNIRVSFMKKEWKNHFQDLQKIIKDNKSFDYLMKYPMNQKEIHQFLFFNINRKVTASSSEDLKTKYKSIIEQMIDYVKNIKKNQQSEIPKPLKRKILLTEKDKAKQKLIEEAEELKRMLAEQNRKKAEQAREKIQRQLMTRQDRDIEDLTVSSNFSSDYYV